ncbi:hypothetical protein AB0H36_05315 [Kribbella sp. NPDC050820]|uniref:hypothetical protein n=1 Tax=Kribbella sp. NPDC050820 TaxID=3155408 RepID=UPI0033FA68DB
MDLATLAEGLKAHDVGLEFLTGELKGSHDPAGVAFTVLAALSGMERVRMWRWPAIKDLRHFTHISRGSCRLRHSRLQIHDVDDRRMRRGSEPGFEDPGLRLRAELRTSARAR